MWLLTTLSRKAIVNNISENLFSAISWMQQLSFNLNIMVKVIEALFPLNVMLLLWMWSEKQAMLDSDYFR